ncbi:MAG: TVP38/TMEM64 family protein [Puniceicoccales bacterium]
MKKNTRKLITGFVVLAVLLVAVSFLPLKEWLEPVWDFIEDSGPWGYLVYVAVGVVISLLFLPISPVVIAGGLLFGFWKGFGMSCLVLLISSAIGFWLGGVFWDRLNTHSAFQNKYFKAIRKAIEAEGIYLVGLLRLTPFIHYTVGNLFYGSLNLRMYLFLVASMLGMIPGTAVLVYGGDLARRSFGSDVELGGWHIALFVIGIALFVWITTMVTKKTQRILKEEMA